MSTLKQRQALYTKARDAYYNDPNGESPLTDDEFDRLEDELRSQCPDWPGLKVTGAKVGKKAAVRLPFPMPSLDKVYLEKPADLSKWLRTVPAQTPLWLSPKVDGNAVLCKVVDGQPIALYTRGDGVTGKDITHLMPYMTYLPSVGASLSGTWWLRLEAVLTEDEFSAVTSTGEFATPRAAVSGIMNRMDPHTLLRRIRFYVLRAVSVNNGVLTPVPHGSVRCGWVPHVRIVDLTAQEIIQRAADSLGQYRRAMGVRLDGMVLARASQELPECNPMWAIALKSDAASEQHTTTVKTVEWNVSRHGKLAPKLVVAPVTFDDGTKVTYASGKNAKFLSDSGIGIGAKVTILRAGEIIPEVVAVVARAKNVAVPPASLGDVELRGVDYYVVGDEHKQTQQARGILYAMRALGIDHLGEAFAAQISADYEQAEFAAQWLSYPEDFLGVDQPTAVIRKAIREFKLSNVTPAMLVDATGIFGQGFGPKRSAVVAELLRATPRRNLPDESLFVAALGPKTGALAARNAKTFLSWLNLSDRTVRDMFYAQPKERKQASDKLADVIVTFTGYRDAKEADVIELNGGTIADGLTKKTTVLLYRDGGKASSKCDKARAQGTAVMRWGEFCKQYGVA